MPKTTPTVAEFLAALTEDKRDAITQVHKATWGRETCDLRPET